MVSAECCNTFTSSNCNNYKGKIKSKQEPWCWLVSWSLLSTLCSAPAFVTAPFPTLTCSLPGWQLPCSCSTQQSRKVRGTDRWEMVPGRQCRAPGAPLDTRAARIWPGLHPGTGSSAQGHRCCVPTALHSSSCRAGGFSDHVFNQNASKYDFIFIGKDSFLSLN